MSSWMSWVPEALSSISMDIRIEQALLLAHGTA